MTWRADTLPVWLGRSVFALGLAVLLLWFVAPQWIGAVFGSSTPTKPVTAVCLLAVGAILGGFVSRRTVRIGIVVVVVLLAVGRVADALGAPTLLVGRVAPVDWGRWTPDGDGRMAVGTALVLAAVALALARPDRGWWMTILALPAFVLAYTAILGHLYGASGLYHLQSETAMALVTAVGLLALAAATLLQPATPLASLLGSPGIAGSLTRRLLPWAVGVPPLVGWLRLEGQEHHVFDPRFGIAVMVLAFTLGMVLVVFAGARTAHRVDAARERAAAELELLNAALGERVAVAVAEAEEGRDRLRVLLERTPVGIFETAPDGTRRFTNQRWREIAGLTLTDGAGTAWSDVLHPEDRDWVVRDWQAAVAAGSEWSARYRYLRPDGTVTWVDTVAVAVRSGDGEVQRWLGSVTDVTEQVLSAQRLAASEQRYRSVVTSMAEGVLLQAADGRVLTANDAACRLLGTSRERLLGPSSSLREWDAVHEDGSPFRQDERPSVVAVRTGGSVRDVTMGVRRSDGTQIWVSVNAEPLLAEGDVTGIVTTFADVTAARLATAALRRSEQQFRTAMEHAPIGMALLDLTGRAREVNRALCRLVGYAEDQLVGEPLRRLVHHDDRGSLERDVAVLLDGSVDHSTSEQRFVTRQGEVLWMRVALSLARGESQADSYLVAQIQDVTATRAAAEQLAHRALHDPLTGLPNRDLLMDHLAHALARTARTGATTAVMFCDLDGFKDVNDTYGHEGGDRLLVTLAERLVSAVRPGDTVARLGGDEFVVLAEGLADGPDVRVIAERVRQALAEPVDIGVATLAASGSVGVAIAGSGDDARAVLREADAAMYRAKARGRNCVEVSSVGPSLAPVGSGERG